MLDWSKLKPCHNNKYHSFQELCFQIARALYPDAGTFTPLDDSGGGDGVEFYLTLPGGSQWGWQAKFYFPDRRMSASNRKASIIGSLEKACRQHLNLRKWILCTPTNLSPTERTWFENDLRSSVPSHMSVEFEHWGDEVKSKGV
jgi:hypothetical protein